MLTSVLRSRRSFRRFRTKVLTLQQVSYLLWVCQGRSDLSDSLSQGRTVPSAGATYPLEVFVVCGDACIEQLDAGIYQFNSELHGLEQKSGDDIREDLARACFSQSFIAQAPSSLVIAADYRRTGMTYGERGIRYVHMEVGHAGQNIYLACGALGLGTVAVGAFNDEDVSRTLDLPLRIEPLYVMPIGCPA
jgi:SagB-type dehydrogenase family enzyme